MNLDLTPLAWRLAGTPLAAWANGLQAQLDAKLDIGHGDLPRWRRAVEALPDIQPSGVELRDAFRLDSNCDEATRAITHEPAAAGLISDHHISSSILTQGHAINADA